MCSFCISQAGAPLLILDYMAGAIGVHLFNSLFQRFAKWYSTGNANKYADMSTWALVRMQPGTCTENQRETSDFECQVYHALERLSKCVCVCTCSWTRTCTLDRFRMETPLVLEGLFTMSVTSILPLPHPKPWDSNQAHPLACSKAAASGWSWLWWSTTMETHANVKEISVAEANSVRPKFIKPQLLEPAGQRITQKNFHTKCIWFLKFPPLEAKNSHKSSFFFAKMVPPLAVVTSLLDALGGIRMNQGGLRLRTQMPGF